MFKCNVEEKSFCIDGQKGRFHRQDEQRWANHNEMFDKIPSKFLFFFKIWKWTWFIIILKMYTKNSKTDVSFSGHGQHSQKVCVSNFIVLYD